MFAANVAAAIAASYAEAKVIPEAAAVGTWGLPWQIPAFLGAPLGAWILMRVVTTPEEFMREPRVTDDTDRKDRTSSRIVAVGYALNLAWFAACAWQLFRLTWLR
jgi:hypothetical protein